MTRKELPPVELLRKLLRYDPDTGKLFWRERTPDMFEDAGHTAIHSCAKWNGAYLGAEAGWINNRGYKMVTLDGKYLAHRVIWSMWHGLRLEPSLVVDHVNGDKLDNRITNLEPKSQHQNTKNQKIRKSNLTGAVGVSFDRNRQKFYASIRVKGKTISLGRHDNLEAAIKARMDANLRYGFHPNHGRA